MSLHHNQVALSLRVRIPGYVFERHLPASPYVVGEALADAVTAEVRRQGLGYYPPLEFFIRQGVLDEALVESVSGISWFITNLVRQELQKKLRGLFATVRIESIQTLAYTMPPVRPGSLNAFTALVEHYTPDVVKVGLRVSAIERRENSQALAGWAGEVCRRRLEDAFGEVEVTSARCVE
ncbi:MAG: hypothetical protein D6721_08735 [Gammaproteobacteria bacterium]|nr:MAG: hypothetical protein D6721_08735 [Gammaproteobacteria bacterium]